MAKVAIDAAEVASRILGEGIGTLLSRGQAAALIASLIEPHHAANKAARNRVAMRLDRDAHADSAYVRGKIAMPREGLYPASDVLRWGRDVYGARFFSDFPPTPRVVTALIEERVRVSDEATLQVLPGTIERCHERIRQLEAENSRFRKEIFDGDNLRRHALVARFKTK